MARAYGSSATLLLKRETTYGQAAAGDYIRIPFNRCTLSSEQGLIDDPVLGQGRDPYAPLQDVIMDEGEIVVPVDPRHIGLWLTGLLGAPVTTDDGEDPATYTHVFASGEDSLPSYTIEVGHSQVPAYFQHAGVVFDSIALEFTRSGAAAATIQASPKASNASMRARAARPQNSTSGASASSKARSAGAGLRSPTSPPVRSPTPTTWRRSRPSAPTA